MNTLLRRALVLMLIVLLAGCAGAPPPPDWQLNAQGAIERAQDAYLSGNSRIADVEFSRVRGEIARTGRADLLARAELVRCATRVASLDFGACAGFDALARDAAAPEQAYARYLQAQATPQDAPMLPPQHRPMLSPQATGAALASIEEPLSRLVAAGVLMRSGRADPPTIAQAIDTASGQGWRRPLLAWLGVQEARAESAGDAEAVARIRRRIALVDGAGQSTP
jgi:hypothetical protein